jgi:adenylate kinase family enzyme
MPQHQPRLIIICGFAGAGKSTVAAKLSETFRLPLFDADVLGHFLLESFKEQHVDKDHELLSHVDLWRVNYDVFFNLIKQQLLQGLTVILENNMGSSWRWKHIQQIKDSVESLSILPIRLSCPFEVLVERVLVRSQNDQWGRSLDEAFMLERKSFYDFIEQFTYPGLVTIDATQESDIVLTEAVKYVENWLQ